MAARATKTTKKAAKTKVKNTKAIRNSEITQIQEPEVFNTEEISKPRSKKFIYLAASLLLLIAFVYLLKSVILAATVNNKPVFRYQVVKELEKQNGGQVLDDLITRTLINQEVAKKNITVSNDEVQAEIKNIEENYVGEGQKLEDLLSLQGMTRKDLEERIAFQKKVEKLLADDVKVTDEDINNYIKENKATLPTNLKEDELKKSVESQLKQEKLTEKFQALVTSLKQSAKVRYFVKYQ